MSTQNKFIKRVEKYHSDFFGFFNALNQEENKPLVHGDIMEIFKKFTDEHENNNEEFHESVEDLQESFSIGNTVYIDVREKIGLTRFFHINLEDVFIEEISTVEYLKAREFFVDPNSDNDILNLNFEPFYKHLPRVRDPKNIGNGVEVLNRFLSSSMFNDIDKWKKVLFDFIKIHKYKSEQLILNNRIDGPDHLNEAIDKLLKKLSQYDTDEPYENVCHLMQELGFEKGLGKNVEKIRESLEKLDNLLNAPDHISLKEFMSRIPMVFNITVVSPHGYFAQENVLGKPDTGGQVVYILDQVKALEKALIESLKESGLDVLPKIIILTRQIPNAGNTKCNKRLEKIHNTKNTWILRVPFREHNKKITDNWVTRFEIWPYLEEFAEDSYIQLKAEFGGRPDLVIGNYSDGNLVSYLLSKKFDVTQCCIAHALEKSKYLFSDLYWEELDDHYNFSCQFTADLIAMNSSDFQITSTYQEIAGTEDSVGQYETHKHFTLPNLYRVENGVDLNHIKFNILSPGVSERVYFPYTKTERRISDSREYLNSLFFENLEDPEVVGELEHPERTPIFSMARLDKTKNLTSLVEWYAKSPELQEKANLIIVAGNVDASQSQDKEEIEQIHKMHGIIEENGIHNKIRWIGKLFRKNEGGEAYRVIADKKGVFVQPGLFEGFGLTVIEAMISGVPVIATQYGGPLEIIQNKINGLHIDPVDAEQSTEVILEFVNKVNEDEKYWDKFSKNAIKRVNEAYNWRLYSERLLSLAKIYGFWKYSTNLETEGMESYLELIYRLLLKPRAAKILEKHNSL